jgi:hypothetical protein
MDVESRITRAMNERKLACSSVNECSFIVTYNLNVPESAF